MIAATNLLNRLARLQLQAEADQRPHKLCLFRYCCSRPTPEFFRGFFYFYQMVDVVIPLGFGSKWKNNELKYSLRSLAKYLSGIRRVVIVADLSGLPPFLTNVIHIPCPDATNTPSINTYRKILKACSDKRVSPDFLLSNDDFLLLQQFNAPTFPNYHKGTLSPFINFPGTQKYKVSLRNTARLLKRLGKPMKHFGIHCPMLINKENFFAVHSMIDWSIAGGYSTRSLYGNIVGLQSSIHLDNKIQLRLTPTQYDALFAKQDFNAIFDEAICRDLGDYLQARFPEKSPWEK